MSNARSQIPVRLCTRVDEAVDAYADVMAALPADPDRKTFALAAVKSPSRSALFLIPDGPDTARRIAEARTSEEGQEGLRAFLEKRPPSWLG